VLDHSVMHKKAPAHTGAPYIGDPREFRMKPGTRLAPGNQDAEGIGGLLCRIIPHIWSTTIIHSPWEV
jgi:hypothetical protein